MKYISVKSVVEAYKGFQDCMTNKSWGYLALLKGCNNSIEPSVSYEVNLDGVSNFLENIFNLSQTKKQYNSGRSLYVVFSNKWEKYFNDQGKHIPNIYDIAVWAYRRTSFEDNITIESILQKFASEFNIPLDIIYGSFNTHAINIEFSNSLYLESSLKTELKNIGVDVSRENIDAKKGSVVASPGEISRGPFFQTLYSGLEMTDYVLILQSNYHSLYGNGIKSEDKGHKSEQRNSLQQIFYGAPGTGKSHTINEETKDEDVIRTTFHPDTDYSTFVGAYKPTTALLPICDELGQPMKIGATTLHKEQIVYEFVAQSFLQAYVNAWKKYDEGDKQYLVIEEINRGNCAQIFGDLFQLLDRNDYGFSDYPIKADADMKRQLLKAFAGLSIAQRDKVNAMYEGKDIVSQVLDGDILLLPSNLYIWATMNTSDQSLFPIDSAFKRRWDWTYMPISDAGKNWIIEVDGNNYDWWLFLEKINEKIGSTTNSEDKKLGYFFCKAQDGIISAKTFVGKVIFYLWNDVFKDYEFGDAIFNDEDGSKLSFDKFYTSEGKNSKVVEEKVALFLKNLGLIPIEISKEESEIEDEDGNTPESNSRNYDKFTVNDGAECAKNKLAIECIKEYIKLNPNITAQEVYKEWNSLGSIVPHFIETKEQFDSRTDNSKRSDAVDCYGTTIYVARDGYGCNGQADTLMKLVNEKDWGITIKKIIK
ncbi:AAA family ATPase [uncultured Alloprevotella sp.]|uniref:AAA family ATPase n=1 Tax=uncultured Alloprevotella sp. TaxID=1283315 RepID=UPI00325FD613